MLSTEKGLFLETRLLHGIASSTAIFFKKATDHIFINRERSGSTKAENIFEGLNTVS